MASTLSASVGPVNGSRNFKKTDTEMKQFVIDFLWARGYDDPTNLTNQQLMSAYLDELVAVQRDIVGKFRGSQQLITLEQEHQAEIDAAKTQVEAGVDV